MLSFFKDGLAGETARRIVAEAWINRASDLARWAWTRLINRTDVWGGYHPLADRNKQITLPDGNMRPLGKTTTRPARSRRGRVMLTPAVLERHFRATAPEYVIGLHTTSPENTSRWGAIEVDHHGPTSTPPAVNLAAALAWFHRLRGLGFHPLLTESNGRGGYHLLLIFNCPVSTAKVYQFLQWVVADHATLGIAMRPETFPKQPAIAPGRYGNWLRLVGRHHTLEHWSTAWDGDCWRAGAGAVDLIMALPGDSPDLIPSAAQMPPKAPPRLPAAHVPSGVCQQSVLAARIRAYLAKLPTGLGEGQHRDDFAFQLAAFLGRDLALSDTDALPWLLEWDSRQAVCKGTERLLQILANARRYGHRPVGSGLAVRPARKPRHRHVILTSVVEAR